MAAPWGIKFHEDIFLIVYNDLVIIMSDNHLNRSFLRLGDGLRFDAWLDFTVDKILNEFSHIIMGELLALIKGEFLILDGFLNSKSREFVSLQVEIAGMSAKGFGINDSKVDFALVFDGQRLESLGQLGALLGSFGEDVG